MLNGKCFLYTTLVLLLFVFNETNETTRAECKIHTDLSEKSMKLNGGGGGSLFLLLAAAEARGWLN